jgi:nitrate/nitrite transporter NarK
LICESSHGKANSILANAQNLGFFFAQMLLLLNGEDGTVFKTAYIFDFFGVMNIAVFVGVVFFMKDVIKSKDFEIRRERSDSTSTAKRTKFILK